MNFLRNSFFNKTLLLLLLLSGSQPLLQAAEQAQPEDAETYTEHKLSTELASPLRQNFSEAYEYWARKTLPSQNKVSDEEFRNAIAIHRNEILIIDAMEKGKKQKNPFNSKEKLLQDLQMINNHGSKSVLQNIKRPITAAGNFTLLTLLNQEFQPRNIIKKRQAFIKMLVENNELRTTIQDFLNQIKNSEEFLIKGVLRAEQTNFEGAAEDIFNGLDKIHDPRSKLITMVINCFIYVFNKASNHSDLSKDIFELFKLHGLSTILLLIAFLLAKDNNQRAWAFFAGLVAILFEAISFITQKEDLEQNFDAAKNVGIVLKLTDELQDLVNSYDSTNSLYAEAFDDKESSFHELCEKLNKSNFTESSLFSYAFTRHGKTKNLLTKIKHASSETGSFIRLYGEIDAYQSIAQMIIDSKDLKNSSDEPTICCFAEFIEDSPVATLQTTHCWYPLINNSHARTNEIFLGGAKGNSLDVILTGPNMAGKSAFLKSLLNNIVFAQTFGIAFAETFKLTPFTIVLNRANVSDNTAEDESKFMSEVKAITTILSDLKKLNPCEHALVIADEMFTGTEITPAVKLSTEIFKHISTQKNVIFLAATHYDELTNVENATNHVFKNYKVSVIKDPITKKLIYNYKVIPGIGNTNVAFDIFLEQLKKSENPDTLMIDLIERAQLQDNQPIIAAN
jgi:hypothetical protein